MSIEITPRTDPSHDVLRLEEPSLEPFFRPRSVAVIGATETVGSVGRTLLQNLIGSPFGGIVYPVNPKRASVLGVKAYPGILEVPGDVDLAVIATPAPSVPGVIKDCARKGVRGAVVISAGFKETGPAGIELERQVVAEARAGRMRVVGPNCLGVMNPLVGLNATFAQTIARSGNVGFISQSGALCTAVLDWSLREMVGFSAFISVGSMADVGWGDLIDYLGNDPSTQSIVIYMESIGDARSFLTAAREVALTKPIIVIKAGRTEMGAKAAASHTGALTGSDEVLDAAFRRCGVLRVDRIADLFYMAGVLARQPRPAGPRLAIVTNAGGPGVLAADGLVSGGGQLAALQPETVEALNAVLPGPWSHGNPVDVLGDAGPDRYAKTLEILGQDPGSDGVLVILTPQAMTDPTQTAEYLKSHAHTPGKPVLASWMGGTSVAAGDAILNAAGVPVFPYPDTAAQMFNYLWRYSYNIKGLYETPNQTSSEVRSQSRRKTVRKLIDAALASGRTLLTEVEAKAVLQAYDIPTVPTRVARSPAEAASLSEEFGYPVVLKLHSETITHKTDVGGVKLNLQDTGAVRNAYQEIEESVAAKAGREHFQGVAVQPMVRQDGYELILGSSIDPQFGPVLLFGMGGQLVEVLKDRSLALPPLNTTLARRMMEHTKLYKALQGVRGRKSVDLAQLEEILVRFSELVLEQPFIKEIDVNPLLASAETLLALDARVLLHDPGTREEDLPRPAIRPYPAPYVRSWMLKDTPLTLRPIRPEDEPLVVRFHGALSEESVYMRYFTVMKLSRRVAHDRLIRICFNDYDREIALVAEKPGGEGSDPSIVAIARLSKIPNSQQAEFALLVADAYQGQGLGTQMLQQLIAIAREEKVGQLRASVLASNVRMQRICRKLGFQLTRRNGEELLEASMVL